MRKTVVIGFLIFTFVGLASAQIPTSGNVFFGYSYYNTNLSLNRGSLNGWEGTLEGKVFPYVGIVADFSGHYGNLDFPTPAGLCAIGVVCSPVSASVHEENVFFGPRISVPVGKWRPFAEGMVGIAHANTNGFGSDTSFASALGGGLDYRLVRLVSWRIQGDYIRTDLFHGTQNNVRISTGISIHF